MKDKSAARGLLLALGAALFCVLAVGNSAGYRYGVSDLAFYLPAAFQRAEPALFPRDTALLDVQARLTLADEGIAGALGAGRAVGLGDHRTVYALHIGSLLLLFTAAVVFGRALFRSPWAVAAFVTAMTLRHAVGRTGVNTLEGYFHPRVLAFAIGLLALAAFLRRGTWPALVIGLIAAAVHTTTAFWFLVCLGVAGLVSERRERFPLLALGIVAAGMLAYAISSGPLAGRLQPMDPEWLAVIAEKDYLFPSLWPLDAWLIPAVYIAVCAYAFQARSRAGELQPRERGLFAGGAALVVIFVLLLPPMLVRSALTIQMQPSRVFWILDLLAIVSVIWIVGDLRGRHATRAPMVLTAALLLFSVSRSVYLLAVRFPERSIARAAPAESDWVDAMRYAQTTDVRSHWIAHPDHTFLYGSGVRVSGRRDVFMERSKDPAIAMYDRAIAMRVAERLRAVGDFDALTADRARELASRYDLDYLITEMPLALPVAYRNGRFQVYRLQEH
jgi:hypothetical protein